MVQQLFLTIPHYLHTTHSSLFNMILLGRSGLKDQFEAGSCIVGQSGKNWNTTYIFTQTPWVFALELEGPNFSECFKAMRYLEYWLHACLFHSLTGAKTWSFRKVFHGHWFVGTIGRSFGRGFRCHRWNQTHHELDRADKKNADP